MDPHQELQELGSQIEQLRRERDALRADLTQLYQGALAYRTAQQAAKEALWLAELGDAQDKEAARRKVREVIPAQDRLFAARDAVATPSEAPLPPLPPQTP